MKELIEAAVREACIPEAPASLPDGEDPPAVGALPLAEAFHWLLDDGSPVCVADGRGSLRFANRGYRRLLPMLQIECTLSSGEPEIPAAPWIRETLRQAQPTPGESWSVPIERRHVLDFGGRPEVWVSRPSVHYDGRGVPHAVVARYRRDEDPVELRRHLTAMRERFDDIARMVSDWIWETDRQLNITFVSSRVQEATG